MSCFLEKHQSWSLIEAHSLDLTAGSRAYLIEPHWNPMIEEQALCRVHRVGQLREVTTIRYLVRNSFEEASTNNSQAELLILPAPRSLL